jgi:hypothetical protein
MPLPRVALVVAANQKTWEKSNRLAAATKSFLCIAAETKTEKIICPVTTEAADSVLIRRFVSFLKFDSAVFCSAPDNVLHGKDEEQAAYNCRNRPVWADPDEALYNHQRAESFKTVYVVTHDLRLLASMENLAKLHNTHRKHCEYVYNARKSPSSREWHGPSVVSIIGPYALQTEESLNNHHADEVRWNVLAEDFSFETAAPGDSGVLILFDGDSVDKYKDSRIGVIGHFARTRATKEAGRAAHADQKHEREEKAEALRKKYPALMEQYLEAQKKKAAKAAAKGFVDTTI